MKTRHPLLLSLRWLLPAAAVLSAVLGALSRARVGHIVGGALSFILAFVAIVQARIQPVLILDDRGYAIEQGGRVRFFVAWSEVKKVRADAKEHALYIDCGDKARNLLVPPERGYGFRFADARRLYERVIAAVGDRVEQVERLDDGKPRA